ncbi:MAG: hypothetical protein Kow00127_02700 [Bacteroidales bacterium]
MKRFITFFSFFLASTLLFAEIVPVTKARMVAKNAYYEKVSQYVGTTTREAITIDEEFTIGEGSAPELYIFNMSDMGYIIVSGEDLLRPVLAYSFESRYEPGRYTDNFSGWLEGRAGAVSYARTHQIPQPLEVKQTWEKYTAPDFTFVPAKGKSVEPLLTCTWNQDWPYNYMMPADPQGPGGHVYVGCVATAMAQIMYYWRYPLVGDHSKTHSYGGYPSVTVNYGQTNYDWDGMVDNSDSRVNVQMAQIGLHAAVAVSMHWGPYGSGAQSTSVPFAMSYYFRYDTDIEYLEKQGIAISTWKGYIENELDNICPIYYSGYNSNNEGHAFVLDGYHNDGTFHFNFGWSGYGNGWFDITDPSGYEWYYGQGMVRKIYPSDPDYPYGCSNSGERTSLVGSFQDGSGPQENYDPATNCSWLINPQTEYDSVSYIKLNFNWIDTDPDDIITMYDGSDMSAPVLGTWSGTTTPSGYITSSGNQVLVTFEADGDATTGAGFQIEYQSIQPTFCSGLTAYTEPTGTVSDGSGSFYYKNGTNCLFQINPTWGTGLTLTFTEFGTEEGADILKIIDASNNQVIAELSGTELPDPIVVPSGKVNMVFQTDLAVNNQGFTLEYHVDNVGVAESAFFPGLSIMPNPANRRLNVTFTPETAGLFTAELTDLAGRVVKTISREAFNGVATGFVFDVSNTKPGLYLLKISDGQNSETRKVVISR